MERYLTSLTIREMQVKKAQWYISIIAYLLEWLLSKRQGIINVKENVETREPLYTIDRTVKWCRYYGKQCRGSWKN